MRPQRLRPRTIRRVQLDKERAIAAALDAVDAFVPLTGIDREVFRRAAMQKVEA